MVLTWGGGTSVVFFAHARPTLAVLWTFPHTFPEDTNFATNGMRDGQNSGGGGEGRTKQVDQCAHEHRKTGTHTPGTEMDQEATNPEFVEMSDFDEEEGKGAGPWCLRC